MTAIVNTFPVVSFFFSQKQTTWLSALTDESRSSQFMTWLTWTRARWASGYTFIKSHLCLCLYEPGQVSARRYEWVCRQITWRRSNLSHVWGWAGLRGRGQAWEGLHHMEWGWYFLAIALHAEASTRAARDWSSWLCAEWPALRDYLDLQWKQLQSNVGSFPSMGLYGGPPLSKNRMKSKLICKMALCF